MSWWEPWTLTAAEGVPPVGVGAVRLDSSLAVGRPVIDESGSLVNPNAVARLRIRWRPDVSTESQMVDPVGVVWAVQAVRAVGRRHFLELDLAQFLFQRPPGLPWAPPPGWGLADDAGVGVRQLKIAELIVTGGVQRLTSGFRFAIPEDGFTISDSFADPLNGLRLPADSVNGGVAPVGAIAISTVSGDLIGFRGLADVMVPYWWTYFGGFQDADDATTAMNSPSGNVWPSSSVRGAAWAIPTISRDTNGLREIVADTARMGALSVGDSVWINSGPYV